MKMERMGLKGKPDGLSVWGPPGTVVKGSGYGDVTYLEWCRLEVERLAKKGDRRAIRRMADLICVGARIGEA